MNFLPGLELSRRFYWEAVRPLLDEHFPSLPYAAALIGAGSDVLGFDTAMSMDHDWFPRLQLFLRDEDAELKEPVTEMLRGHLPHVFLGFPVDASPVSEEDGTAGMELKAEGPVSHRVLAITLREYIRLALDWDLDDPLEPADWLTFPSQALRSLTAGVVHHDGVGVLTALRQRLAWYPRDVWLYLLASGWQRIAEEEHLMPRAGYVGDELGSSLIGSRLARDVMSLGFLMERQYAPYPKWFGTAFGQLRCAGELRPLLWDACCAETWKARQAALCAAFEALARMHNALNLTLPLPEQVSSFFDRPFQVIHGGTFAEALVAQISDPDVQRIATRDLVGSIDQFSDNTKLRGNPHWRSRIRRLYEEE